MQSQLCRICGQRHHRYEPHRFTDPKVKFMYESEPSWPAEDQPQAAAAAPPDCTPSHATPNTPESGSADKSVHQPAAPLAQPREARTRDTATNDPCSHRPETAATPPPSEPSQESQNHDTPDTAPLSSPLSLAVLDDTALHNLRNLVMAEYMRRKRAARKEQQ